MTLTNTDVAAFLRGLADLYFANYALKKDATLRSRGYAFAKAAEAVAALPNAIPLILNGVPVKGVGETTVALVREYLATGHSSREAALQHGFELPEGLQPLAALAGFTTPFLFVLSTTYGVKDLQSLLEALPNVQKDNERVYLRVRAALMSSAGQEMLQSASVPFVAKERAAWLNLKIDGATTGRLPTDRENKP